MPPSPFPSNHPTRALWGGILLPWEAPVKNWQYTDLVCPRAHLHSHCLTLAWLYPSRQHTPPICWARQLKSPASTQASAQRRSLGADLVKTHGHGLAADHCSAGCQWLYRDTRCFWSGIFRTTRPKTQATTPVWTLSSPDISHSKLESVQGHQQESLSFSVPTQPCACWNGSSLIHIRQVGSYQPRIYEWFVVGVSKKS